MLRLIILSLSTLLAATPALAEDAAHRADRLRTQQLNADAQAVVDQRNRSNARKRRTGAAAHERYQRELADWRRRVAACRSGDYPSCDLSGPRYR
jgi:hypothetical protein